MDSHCKISNDLHGLIINGRWTQDHVEIRKEVEDYYGNRYRDDQFVRLDLDGMNFDCIAGTDRDLLKRQFSEEEV